MTSIDIFTDEDAKPIAAKYLTKWRPAFAERLKGPKEEEKKTNGVGEEAVAS
jgi:symplekin